VLDWSGFSAYTVAAPPTAKSLPDMDKGIPLLSPDVSIHPSKRIQTNKMKEKKQRRPRKQIAMQIRNSKFETQKNPL
jgi:hypothetical protein